MKDLEEVLSRAQQNVNQALAEYESDSTTLAHDFKEIKLQACIFQYDICVEMASLQRNQPMGFAKSIALKGLIHRLYEYDQIMNKHLIRRMLSLATSRGISINRDDIKALRKQWRVELIKLQQWSEIRNQTTGHYGHDIALQVQLLKSINFSEIMSVTQAFLNFNMGILITLKNIGRGNGA